MDNKECTKCKKVLPISEFKKCGRGKYYGKYLTSICKKCYNELSAEWRRNNPEAMAKHQKKWMEKDCRRPLFASAKHRAKKDNIPFDLVLEDIPLIDVCPVFNVPFTVSSSNSKGPSHFSRTLDKIIPELGYVKGNVQVISHLANAMKRDATHEQLNQFADWIKNGIHFKQEK